MTGFDHTAQFNRASGLAAQGKLLEAAAVCRDALDRFPGHPAFGSLYSNLLCRLGDADAAWPVLEAVMKYVPDNPDLWSALANAANAGCVPDAQRVFEFHRAYGRALRRSIVDIPLPIRDPDPERPLRVGIVTYDFKRHSSVSFFMSPLIRHLPAGEFPITAYHVGPEHDQATRRFEAMVSRFRHMPAAAHEVLARQIRVDGIDIVLELIGHTGRRSLPAMEPRCAPVQVSYLGYSNTTGVASMDWRIVDSITDPPGAERLATERLWRLDPCFVCFEPTADAPPVSAAPATRRGHVTFGSFSELFKLTRATMERWAAVLRAVPTARLLLKNRASTIPDGLRFLTERLTAAGLDMSRVEIRGPTATYAEHLAVYGEVDIALDTYPYNGTTTVCDSLLMGVPILGVHPGPCHDRHAARVTLSLLTAAGMPEFIVGDEHELVARCAALASDAAALDGLRPEIRRRFLASPVCDGPAFAERFAGALRGMWRERVAAGPR